MSWVELLLLYFNHDCWDIGMIFFVLIIWFTKTFSWWPMIRRGRFFPLTQAICLFCRVPLSICLVGFAISFLCHINRDLVLVLCKKVSCFKEFGGMFRFPLGICLRVFSYFCFYLLFLHSLLLCLPNTNRFLTNPISLNFWVFYFLFQVSFIIVSRFIIFLLLLMNLYFI